MSAPTPLQKLAHPAKVQNALRRRLFKRRMEMVPLERGWPLLHIGTAYGGWVVPDGVIGPDWVCYCVGTGTDISFDLGLIERYGATVVSFEPAPGSLEYVREEAAGVDGFTFMPVGIGRRDGSVPMYLAEDSDSTALSATNLQATETWVERPVRSLPSVMDELGHERVDLLKLSLEGWEYEVVPYLDYGRMGVRVLAVELTHSRPARKALELIELLRSCGFVPVHRKLTKMVFINEASVPRGATSSVAPTGQSAAPERLPSPAFHGPRRPDGPRRPPHRAR